MRRLLSFLICILFAGVFTLSALDNPSSETYANANQKTIQEEPVRVTLLSQDETIQPGHPFWIAIQLDVADHWHIYWKNPGDSGMAPAIEWNLPEGFSASTLCWPTPKQFSSDSLVGFGYEGKTILLAKITPPEKMKTEAPKKISAEVKWVVCSDETCLPGSDSTSIELAVRDSTPEPKKESTEVFEEAQLKLPKENKTITAVREQGLLKVTLKDTEGATKASFYPDENCLVDTHEEAILSRSSTDSKQVIVALKETDDATPNSTLKGVLVLHQGNESEKNSAYEISIPLSDKEGEVSMADDSKKSSLISLPTPEIPAKILPMEFEGGLGLALLFAFAGGMTLNLMPCVLPVLSFKVLNFVKMAGQSRKLIFKHGLIFTLGVLLSFWVLTAALLILQAYGRSVGWGFQLQEPLFVATLAAILLIFCLSLFGVFEIGTSLISIAGQAQHNAAGKGSGLFGSFLSGVLATAVATPCTGPFLGSAIGFAVTLPPILTLLIFTSLGLGMSLPYLVLAAFPSMLRFLPKPGGWMVIFKELMGFVMLATVLWLVWVFGAQTSTFSLFLLLAGFFFLALASWIYGKRDLPMQKRSVRIVGYVLALSCLAAGGFAIANAASPWAVAMGSQSSVSQSTKVGESEWEDFSPERVAELQKQGIPVFIDFTAKWCLICQANHFVLSTEDVSRQFDKQGVVKMKADWTKNDPVITAELKKFGRSGVPLYVLYGTNAQEAPKILPQVLTPETVLDELKSLAQE